MRNEENHSEHFLIKFLNGRQHFLSRCSDHELKISPHTWINVSQRPTLLQLQAEPDGTRPSQPVAGQVFQFKLNTHLTSLYSLVYSLDIIIVNQLTPHTPTKCDLLSRSVLSAKLSPFWTPWMEMWDSENGNRSLFQLLYLRYHCILLANKCQVFDLW